MNRREQVIALTIVSVLLLPFTLIAACGDPEGARQAGSVTEAELPEPGDPSVYAPPGWPLQIGDIVTMEERDRLDEEFLSPQVRAIHLVGDQVYAAEWEWPEEHDSYTKLLYAGHFPAVVPWNYEKYEHELPERFHGKITYEPVPPYTIEIHGVPHRVNEEVYRAWTEFKRRVRERNAERERLR